MRKHDSNLDTEHTLSHHHVADSGLNIFTEILKDTLKSTLYLNNEEKILLVSLSSLDHVTVRELLRLSTLASDFTRNGHLSTLSSGLHHEAENTITSTADGKAAQKLVLQRLSLSLSVESTVGNALGENLHSSFREVESNLRK